MKKILIILSFFALVTSCENLEDLNKNLKDPTAVAGETLFTYGQRRVFNQMVSTNVNLNNFRLFVQYWTECTYTDESNYDLTTRTTPDSWWDIFYVNALRNFSEANKVMTDTPSPLTEDPQVKKNKLAINDLMTVYCYEMLVEAFGDIPYTEALDETKPLPKYDDAETVYKALMDRIDAALGNMDASFESMGVADNMYQGDVGKWMKFANSMKLRMALLIADKEDAYARTAVEEAAANVFTSVADNGKLDYLFYPPNTNPLYIDLVASGRHDFVPASTIIDSMNSLDDPRRPFYFTTIDGEYVGGEYGSANDFTAFSHVADKIQEPKFPGTLFTYSEVEFFLAEAVERGYDVGGTAEEHYNKAVTASIAEWGGTVEDAAAYLANPRVAYATADGTWQQKIGIQSWIAYYNRGFEAWTQYRKLDFPLLEAPPDALSPLPIRYTYPIGEQTLNGDNWENASEHIGGDAVDTPLFWDVN